MIYNALTLHHGCSRGRPTIDPKRLAITVSLMESHADGAYEFDVHDGGSELRYSVSYSGRSTDNGVLEGL